MLLPTAVVGIALGAAFARNANAPVGVSMWWFAAALCAGIFLSAFVEDTIAATFRIADEHAGDFVAFSSDALIGAAAGVFLSRVAPIDFLDAFGIASVYLFMQTLLVDKLFFGNIFGDTLVSLLGAGGGTQPEYSQAASLAMRGDVAGARALYEDAIRRAPRDAQAYIAFARMLRDDARDPVAALDVLSTALQATRLDARTREAIMREMVDLYVHHLNEPGRAAVLLGRFIDREHAHGDVDWARALLRNVKVIQWERGRV